MNPRVLVVDDNPDLRMIEQKILEMVGFDVLQAGGGAEALNVLAREHGVAAVILDVQMPDMNGWECLRAIRADHSTEKLPVVMATVLSGTKDVEFGWALGCDGYVTKPFDPEDILWILQAAISRPDEERKRVRELCIESLRSNDAPLEVSA